MGSIDIPPFLRDEMKKKIQNGEQKPKEQSIDVPEFLQTQEPVKKKMVGKVLYLVQKHHYKMSAQKPNLPHNQKVDSEKDSEKKKPKKNKLNI